MRRETQNSPQEQNNSLENKKLLELRRIRGISIISKGDTPKIIDSETFIVPSQSSKKQYKVTNKTEWVCECPDFQTRHLECKHIQSIKFFLKVRDSEDVLEFNKELEQEKLKCPNCNSEKITKQGYRKTVTEKKQKYQCVDCKKYFILEPIKNTKVNAKMITFVMDLYYKGLSLRDIRDTISQFYGITLHHETIRRYILKFSNVMQKFTDKIKPTKLGKKINVDEQMVRTKHNEFVWSWNAIDHDTRFLIANNVTKTKYVEDAKEIFQQIKDKTNTNEQITLVTDGLKTYPHAIGQVFHKINDWKAGQKAVKHIFNAGINQVHKNNNMVERYHNEFREFDKVRRGFEEVSKFNQGFRLYHNFIKENSVIGMTPSEKAGIDLKLGRNKWLSLLKLSLKSDAMRQEV